MQYHSLNKRFLRKHAYILCAIIASAMTNLYAANTKELRITTDLHIAAKKGQTRYIKKLIEEGCDPHAKNEQNKTAAECALESNHTIIAAYINDCINGQQDDNLEKLEELYEAIEAGTVDTLKNLLQRHPTEYRNFLGNHPETTMRIPPLHLAIVRANETIVAELLCHGADVDLADMTHNHPLHYAAKHNNVNIGAMLIGRGAEVNAKNSLGETPLHLACKCPNSDNPDLAAILINHNANISSRDKIHGKTPLHVAVETGHLAIVEVLLNHDANPHIPDYLNKFSALQIAIQNAKRGLHGPTDHKIIASINIHNWINSPDTKEIQEPPKKRQRTE